MDDAPSAADRHSAAGFTISDLSSGGFGERSPCERCVGRIVGDCFEVDAWLDEARPFRRARVDERERCAEGVAEVERLRQGELDGDWVLASDSVLGKVCVLLRMPMLDSEECKGDNDGERCGDVDGERFGDGDGERGGERRRALASRAVGA